MTFIETIRKEITEKRNLRESSINAYVGNINKLHSLMFGKSGDSVGGHSVPAKELKNLDFLEDKKKVMETIENKKLSTRKTYLAAIVVTLMAFEKDVKLISYYRDEMEDLSK